MKRRSLLVALLVLLALTSAAAGEVRVLVPLPADLQGELNGAPYRIRVPVNWNGTLLVYAHGYAEYANPPALTLLAADEGTLLSEGYALAASTFRGTGFTVKEGIQSTVALTSLFRDVVGRPRQTIIWGKSMGGLIALGLIETFPGLYDGAVSMCSPTAGTPRRFDQSLDIALAYAVAFEWPDAWGTPGDVEDDIDVLAVQGHVMARMIPALKGSWEFIRLVSGLPLYGLSTDSYYAKGLRLMNMYFATGVRAELEQRAGGAIAQNIGRVYSLTDAQKTYLAGLNVDADGLLAEMNARAAFVADRNARNYVERYVEPSGRINRPVLTVHVIDDALAPPNHAAAYQAAVHGADNDQFLLQKFTNGVGHCAFTTEQDVDSIAAMASWLDTGIRPSDSFFSAPGFDLSYTPPAWPWK